MEGDLNPVALRLVAEIIEDHPGWLHYAAPYGPADDGEADAGSVIFSIPSPRQPTHHLEIAQRGNSIEVAYDCGEIGVRAEQQFIFDEESVDEALAGLQDFVRRIISGHVIIVREPLGRLVRALRGDEVTELASFRSAGEGLGPGATVHRWESGPK